MPGWHAGAGPARQSTAPRKSGCAGEPSSRSVSRFQMAPAWCSGPWTPWPWRRRMWPPPLTGRRQRAASLRSTRLSAARSGGRCSHHPTTRSDRPARRQTRKPTTPSVVTCSSSGGGISEPQPHHPDESRPGHQPLVLLVDRQSVGAIRLDVSPPRVTFPLVAIRHDRQRQGHGRVLMAAPLHSPGQ